MSNVIQVELEVKCETCNKSLDAFLDDGTIYVTICSSCLAEAESTEYDKGYEAGQQDPAG